MVNVFLVILVSGSITLLYLNVGFEVTVLSLLSGITSDVLRRRLDKLGS